MTRILIADDHPFVRYGVKHVLEDEFPGVEIGEAASAPELLEQSGKKRWDMIVLDVTMPGRSGLDALHELKAQCPDIRVLVLSMHPEDQFAVRVLRAGAAGYLTKERASPMNWCRRSDESWPAGNTFAPPSPIFSPCRFNAETAINRSMPGSPIGSFRSWL